MTSEPAGRNADPSFRFDTGRPCLDLVGTVGHRPAEHVERLRSPARLRAWLIEARLPPPTEEIDDAGLARAIDLREALAEILDHAVEPVADGELTDAALDTVNTLAAVAPPVPTVHRTSGRPVVRHDGPVGLDAVLGLLARDAIDLLADDTLRGRLRRCEAGDCRKVFLDTAPRPRRWCSRQYCGTRSRVAAHRSRRQ